jgi:transposase
MILSSKISLEAANTGKQDNLALFIAEYRKAMAFYVDYLWIKCEIDKQKYRVPKFIASEVKPFETNLSARALKCAATQACGMVSARVKKLGKTQFIVKREQRAGKPAAKLQSKYDRLVSKLKKPKTNMVLPELNSICANWETKKTNLFDAVVVISSIGKQYGKIAIPVKRTKHFNSLSGIGKQKTSFLLNKSHVNVRFDIQVEQKTTGYIEGADQGMRTCVTLSDGQVTPADIHGHNLASICKKLSKKRKGSRAFAKAQAHRTNYINWSIKQLNVVGIKQINLEKLRHMGKGKRVSRYLQSFAHKEIRTAMTKACQLGGVRLVEQSNAYRSQRCSHCGLVHKSSRRGELFVCKGCKFTANADLNAAMNHKVKLCDLPTRFNHLPNRSLGFYWNSDGLIGVDGLEITVPVAKKRQVI